MTGLGGSVRLTGRAGTRDSEASRAAAVLAWGLVAATPALGLTALVDRPLHLLSAAVVPSFAAALAIGLAAVVVRFRRGDSVERLQLKWLLYAGALFLVYTGPVNLAAYLLPSLQPLANALFPIAFAAVPVAIVVAIVRYRLYRIDIIIRRTLVYGAVVALLAALYVVVVVMLEHLFLARASGLAVVIATLAIAAAFTPLRRRVRAAVDRRFYRPRYDAALTLARFGAAARDEVDLSRPSDDLLGAVRNALQRSRPRCGCGRPDRTGRPPRPTAGTPKAGG